MKTPDQRYTVTREWCGESQPRWIARFCGEWLRDSEIWPTRGGNQAPAFGTRLEAIEACHAYENMRQRLIAEGLRTQGRAEFYEANA